MSDVFVFGNYFSYNANFDENRTANRGLTKWRSQVAVPSGSTLSDNDWYFINGDVHICNISDLDYQLKNTDPISNEYRIKRTQGAIRVDRVNYLGGNAKIVFEHRDLPAINLDASNPNADRFTDPAHTPKPLVLPEFIDFAEERLELGYDFGATGGASFETTVIETSNDAEQRNSRRSLPLHRFQLGDRSIAESEIDALTEVSYLKEFHLRRLGRKQGFRYKDWNDYLAIDSAIGVGDGVKTRFQLQKAYSTGDAVTYRPITKPVGGKIFLFENGVAAPDVVNDSVNGWHINIETGVLTRAAPLPNGVRLTATFEFDVPVWFETDKIDFSLEFYNPSLKQQVYRLGSVFIQERRIPLAIPYSIAPVQKIANSLDLGIVYNTVESFEITNTAVSLSSGYSKTENKRDDALAQINLGSREYNRAELNLLLAYFWNAGGKNREFKFASLGQNYAARFNEDRLNIKFKAISNNDALFSLSGLKLRLQPEKLYEVPPFSIPLEIVSVDPNNPSDPAISSSGGSSYSGSYSPSSSSNIVPFNIQSFITSPSFDLAPPGDVNTNINYFVAQMFWAGGTMHVFVTSGTSGSLYRLRLVHYTLNLSNGWFFEYQSATSELLKPYIISVTDYATPRIYKTPSGTAYILKANNAVEFGGEFENQTNGILKLEIINNTLDINFISDTELGLSGTLTAHGIYGNNIYLTRSGVSNNLGTFGGFNYIGADTISRNGYPIGTAIGLDIPHNFSVSSAKEADNYFRIYSGSTELLKFYAGTKPVIYYATGDDGSILLKVLARSVCENQEYLCSSEHQKDLVFFYLKSDYAADPVLIDVQEWSPSSNPSTPGGGDSHYIQNYIGKHPSCDRFGNQFVVAGSKMVYYQARSGYGINLKDRIPIAGSVYNKPTITPYGFAIISHSGNLFGTNPQLKLAFVQVGES